MMDPTLPRVGKKIKKLKKTKTHKAINHKFILAIFGKLIYNIK